MMKPWIILTNEGRREAQHPPVVPGSRAAAALTFLLAQQKNLNYNCRIIYTNIYINLYIYSYFKILKGPLGMIRLHEELADTHIFGII